MQLAPYRLDRPVCPGGGQHASHTFFLRPVSAVPCWRYRRDRARTRQRAEADTYNYTKGSSCTAFDAQNVRAEIGKDDAATGEGSAHAAVNGQDSGGENDHDEDRGINDAIEVCGGENPEGR